MSGAVKVNQVLLGSNADQTKNFKITVPTPEDGTLTIERGDGTDVLVVGTDGKVTFPSGIVDDRTWKAFSVPSERALGTVYTNSTNKTIIVRVRLSLPSTNTALQCTINGQVLLGSSILTGAAGTDQWEVPPGATYQPNLQTGASGTVTWFEFRS